MLASKAAVLLLLLGLEENEWALWPAGSPERLQWWRWVCKPLETMALLAQVRASKSIHKFAGYSSP
jgi:hypothetical protein